jgi:hypothetical protein
MATTTFEFNNNTTGSPSWTDIGANTIVFSGSQTDLTTTISTTAWNEGTHIGTDDPGTDACDTGPNASHNNNVKFVASGTCQINSGGTENLNDTNLTEGECTFRFHLVNGSAVATQNSFAYTFDGSVTTNEAVAIEAHLFERGVTATAWTQVNDDSANIGGNNSGERLDLGEKSSATDHTWYFAMSARGESAGAKNLFDIGVALELF